MSEAGEQGARGAQRVANRLSTATSPYLLQHAYNPVDWYPWGAEALGRAKEENKPIFLSIGYSACHWCHVMEREVFENPEIAALMNEHFVNIKVDREERPDLDDVYMLATQLMTGSGGWPMSVWLTPELKPFYAGTYFPPVDGFGRPGFGRLTVALAEAWRTRPAELIGQSEKVATAVADHANDIRNTAPGEITLQAWLAAAIEDAADRFDPQFGGLGSAPKFPPHHALLLWLTLLQALGTQCRAEAMGLVTLKQCESLRKMTIKTLDGMARGGIFDHVGGGFARYSTDAFWLVPHFEKMLYDNAMLAGVYAIADRVLGGELYAGAARKTIDFWLREMTGEDGGFYSALDADSQGDEGKFYVWTIEEIKAALPEEKDAALVIDYLGVTAEGNWEGKNVLFADATLEELAHRNSTTLEGMRRHLDKLMEQLREVRAMRVPPALDDKVLTGWNGLMISACAIAGGAMKEPRYLEAAHRAIGFILLKHVQRPRALLRVSRGGVAHIPAFLEDHAYLLNGLIDLIGGTSPTSLPGTMARKRALELADEMIRLFHDPVGGAFSFAHAGHEQLFARVSQASDGATPSANGVAIRALLRLAQVSGKVEYRELALGAVRAFATAIHKHPGQFCTILLALVEDELARANNPRLGGLGVPAFDPAAAKSVTARVEESSRVKLSPVESLRVVAGGTFELKLVLEVEPGFHVQAHAPEDKELLSTVARLRTELPLEYERWNYPASQVIAGDKPVVGYEGAVALMATCQVSAKAVPGEYVVRATVLTQVCSGTACYPPERVSVELKVMVE